MKKRIFIISLAFVLVLSIFTVMEAREKVGKSNAADINAALSSASSTYLPLSFSVVGDIHDNTGELENALKDLHGINTKTDALIMNGDIVDQGLDEQYKIIQECLTKNSRFLPKTVIRNMGNHEYFNYSNGSNSPSEIEEIKARYLSYSGVSKVYHDIWVKGYHFISLGSEQSNTKELGNTQAFISEDQQKWLEEKLAENYQPGRPVFVFLHQHMSFSAAGRVSRWVGIKQDKEIRDILSKYPEVILFSSHTHTFIGSDNMVYIKEPFTAVHTGAVHNPLKFDGINGMRGINGSQGLYVEISKNKLVIRARDFLDKSWVRGAVYTRNLK